MIEWLLSINPIVLIFTVWAVGFAALGLSIICDLFQCHKNIKKIKGNDE